MNSMCLVPSANCSAFLSLSGMRVSNWLNARKVGRLLRESEVFKSSALWQLVRCLHIAFPTPLPADEQAKAEDKGADTDTDKGKGKENGVGQKVAEAIDHWKDLGLEDYLKAPAKAAPASPGTLQRSKTLGSGKKGGSGGRRRRGGGARGGGVGGGLTRRSPAPSHRAS